MILTRRLTRFNKPHRVEREENLGARSTDRGSLQDDRLRINISRVAGAARNITLGTKARAHAEWKFSVCQTARERNIRREGSFPVPTGNSYFLFSSSSFSSFSLRRVKYVLLSILTPVYSIYTPLPSQSRFLKFTRHATKKNFRCMKRRRCPCSSPFFIPDPPKMYRLATKWINSGLPFGEVDIIGKYMITSNNWQSEIVSSNNFGHG